MRTNTLKITEEEYMDYKNNPKGQSDRFIDRHGNMSWKYGYGFYGMKLIENDEGYFVIYNLGDSCD